MKRDSIHICLILLYFFLFSAALGDLLVKDVTNLLTLLLVRHFLLFFFLDPLLIVIIVDCSPLIVHVIGGERLNVVYCLGDADVV